MTTNRTESAEKMKRLLIESSPMIEDYTRKVCPDCTDICCKQKHGIYQERDIWYLQGLGIVVPQRNEERPLDGPCEMMGERGCVQPRWMRPFKCTWYFCEPLLAALNEDSQRKARRLCAMLQEMADLYNAS
jgi:hypothetical protein